MDVKYQIFISSTFEDLKEERRIVMESILELGHIPVGMELFQASDEEQWQHIQRRIIECDYYIVIIAERYGSEKGGKSYTQLEYEFAKRNKIPVAAFILSEDASKGWPSKHVEFKKMAKLNNFKTLCKKNKLIKYWSNPSELGLNVVKALSGIMRDFPRVGWVRANSGANIDILAEMTKLSEEKRSLQEKIVKLESEVSSSPSSEIKFVMEKLENNDFKYLFESHSEIIEDIDRQDMSILALFIEISPDLYAGLWWSELINKIDCNFKIKIKDELHKREIYNSIINEFVSNDLICIERIQDYMFGEPRINERYKLTEFGKSIKIQFEMKNRAIRNN